MFKIFGKNPSGTFLDKIKQSKNFNKNVFENIELTPTLNPDTSPLELFSKMFARKEKRSPTKPLPIVKENLKREPSKPCITWFGHSSYLIQTREYNILVDPVFNGNASPVSFIGKPFAGVDTFSVDDLPHIDVLILTHDHYDHLHQKTISSLQHKVNRIVCPLGVSSHLIYWGYAKKKITELDWYQKETINRAITITATPSRHFSGRTFLRNKTLWTSYVLSISKVKIYVGGDSGYSSEFRKIGKKYGPFDIAMLECGQYDTDWPYIHMFPHETATAARELKAKILLPVHWGKFILANHEWNEPVRLLSKFAQKEKIMLVTPQIGQRYTIGDTTKNNWWDFD